MQGTTPLQRSPHGLQVQIMLYAVVAIMVGLLAAWLFERLLGWTTGGGAVLEKMSWILIALVWAATSFKLWLDWKKKRYEIGSDSLVIYAGTSKFGSSQTIYRYESIVSVRMTQGFLGKQFGYGDVRITIPSLTKEIVMNDIENPTQQLADIQRRINERSNSTTATTFLG